MNEMLRAALEQFGRPAPRTVAEIIQQPQPLGPGSRHGSAVGLRERGRSTSAGSVGASCV
eukprot:SAG31_NODE_23554_length_502_cov_0.501241_2_plen_59_part_01